jgi:hypothetical protein
MFHSEPDFGALVEAEFLALTGYLDGRCDIGANFAAVMVALAQAAGQLTLQYAEEPPSTPLEDALLKFMKLMTAAAIDLGRVPAAERTRMRTH